jgi:serine/threonine protein phosphatase 1
VPAPASPLRKPCGPSGKRCYAIGDIHGRVDLLADLMDRIEKHDVLRHPRQTSIVLLGDLIDRGPDSKDVVELARTFRSERARLYVLLGNHEEMMLRALDGDLEAFNAWMSNGGLTTMRSYGVDMANLEGLDIEGFRRRVTDCVPPSHLAFLRSSADSIRFGDYLMVHAGIRPGRSIEEQSPKDLRWIRSGFLKSDVDHGFVVVHGHSQNAEIEVRSNRIGIDTGAHHSGILTAVWIEDAERGFLQTAGATMDWTGDGLFD